MRRDWTQITVLALAALMFGCARSTNSSKTPAITLNGVSPNEIRQGSQTEEVILQLSVKDGDADLITDGTTPSLYLKDLRFPTTQPGGYVLPQIDNIFLNPEIGFEGNIVLPLPGTRFIFRDEDTARIKDTIQFEIYLKDKAGNISNTVTTPQIFILK